MRTEDERATILRQLIELRNSLTLHCPVVMVQWTGKYVDSIPAGGFLGPEMFPENFFVTMNDTDQILADLAEVL